MKMSWDQETERNIPPDYIGIVCGECGLKFFVPRVWDRARREDRKSFSCMNGHSLSYRGESESDKLRRERDQLKQENARLEETAAEWMRQAEKNATTMRTAKAQVAKFKKRVGVGTCPCCKRTFRQLAEHMAQKHPQFTAESVA